MGRYIGYDSFGEEVGKVDAPDVEQALQWVPDGEREGLERTLGEVLKDNDGYLVDADSGVEVWSADAAE